MRASCAASTTGVSGRMGWSGEAPHTYTHTQPRSVRQRRERHRARARGRRTAHSKGVLVFQCLRGHVAKVHVDSMEEVTIERRRRRKEGKSERAGARDGRRVREAAGRQNTETEREAQRTDKNLAHLTPSLPLWLRNQEPCSPRAASCLRSFFERLVVGWYGSAFVCII